MIEVSNDLIAVLSSLKVSVATAHHDQISFLAV